MANIGDLVVHLTTDTKQLVDGLKKAQDNIAAWADDIRGLIGGLSASMLGGLGASLSIAAAESDIQATQKLNTVLKDTGGAAGLTSDEINQLATELERVTKFEDDATVGAAALLATFKNIQGENFKEALKLAQDLAALKDIGLDQAATALGKALNDPAEAFGKLAKMGVTFTDDQKQMIKVMAEAGDIAGAQAEMLKALEQTFGGVAKETVSATEQIQLAMGHISEEVGKVLLPFVRALADAVIPFLYDWGHEIAVVSVALGTLITVLGAVVVAQKAVAIGQAAILALGGPAGWGVLIAGAAAFAVAVGGIELAFQGLSEQAANTAEEIKVEFANLQQQVSDFEGGGFSGADFVIKGIDDFKKAMQGLQDEISILNGEFTETDLIMKRMIQDGLDMERAMEFAAAVNMRDHLKQQRKDEEKLKQDAESIRKSVRTPAEVLADEMANLQKLLDSGNIDQQTFDRAKKKAEEAAGLGGDSGGATRGVGALQKGSSEAISAVLTASREQQGVVEANQQVAQNTHDAAAALDEIKTLLTNNAVQFVAMAIG